MTKQIQSLPSVCVKWRCGDNSLPTNCQNHHICYVKHRVSYNTTMHFFWVISCFCVDVFMFSRMSRSLSNLASFSWVSDEFEPKWVCLDTQPLTSTTKHNIWESFLLSFKCLWASILTVIICLAEFFFLHLALVIN